MKISNFREQSLSKENLNPIMFAVECVLRRGVRLSLMFLIWMKASDVLANPELDLYDLQEKTIENHLGADKANKARHSKDLLLLTQWFVGDFDNTKQCRVDTGAQAVESHVVKIWDNFFTDAVWIYEEFQSPPGRVVSQRIYKFMDYTAGRFESKVYTLENFAELAGEYKNLRPFEQFTPENLEDHPYCVVYWIRKGETRFSGSTVGTDCHLLRGRHKYVTNQIDVYPTRVSRTERVFGWENDLVAGPKADEKGSELRRIVPPKPKKVKAIKKPAAKKSVQSGSGKKSKTKKGSNSKGKAKKDKVQENLSKEITESEIPAVEEQTESPAEKKSFWDRFKRKKRQEPEGEPTGE